MCEHKFLQWQAMPSVQRPNGTSDCYYELHCAICEMSLGQQTYVPGTLDIFRRVVMVEDGGACRRRDRIGA